jgi:hypothetical protein
MTPPEAVPTSVDLRNSMIIRVLVAFAEQHEPEDTAGRVFWLSPL